MSDLFSAMEVETRNRMTDREMCEAVNKVVDSLPDDMFKFWAKAAREYSGAHFLDSGGAYGRTHSRPVPTQDYWMEISHGEVLVTINTISWLAGHTELDDTARMLQESFDKFSAESDDYYWSDIENFLKTTDHESMFGEYTYNLDNDFSQDFQFLMFRVDDDAYAAIMTHNGCDARGGFSSPRFVKIIDYEHFVMGWQAELNCIACTCNKYWPDSYSYNKVLDRIGKKAGRDGKYTDRKGLYCPSCNRKTSVKVYAQVSS